MELENLPIECGRTDLISYASESPTQYTLVFPSQKIRNLWETELLRTKEMADGQVPPTTSIAPPTSPLPVKMNELKFLNSMVLQSGRVGMQVRDT